MGFCRRMRRRETRPAILSRDIHARMLEATAGFEPASRGFADRYPHAQGGTHEAMVTPSASVAVGSVGGCVGGIR